MVVALSCLRSAPGICCSLAVYHGANSSPSLVAVPYLQNGTPDCAYLLRSWRSPGTRGWTHEKCTEHSPAHGMCLINANSLLHGSCDFQNTGDGGKCADFNFVFMGDGMQGGNGGEEREK